MEMPLPDGLTPDDLHAGRAGYVHSVEMGSSVDGPGLRATVFLTGCMLRCQYCHNPDSWHLKDGTVRTVDSLMAEIEPYMPFLAQHHGGVTLSGGEPLVQPAFAEAFLRAAKERGLHTALDTSGFLGSHATESLLDAVDLVLLDIKSGLPDVYHAVTGAELAPTLAFAQRLSAMGKPMWVRYVLVPGLTDGVDNVQAVGDFVATLKTVEKVEVLPFHNMAKPKWAKLGLAYTLGETPAPTAEQVAWAEGVLRGSEI